MLHAALTETAEEQLGTEIRRQPDWFREVTHNIEPLLQKKVLYGEWLASNSPTDLSEFWRACGGACQTGRRTKNSWFQARLTRHIELASVAKIGWKCIRDIQVDDEAWLPPSMMKMGTLATLHFHKSNVGGDTSTVC